MNDPRITAYALDELHGTDREQFEAELASGQNLQNELLAACKVTDALDQVSDPPREGLEPQARARLLREISANQENFRARRKIIRFAVPVSLAAAASIAVLLLVSGGTTTQNPAVAAARVPEGGDAATGTLVFLPEDAAKISGFEPGSTARETNIPVTNKRPMHWQPEVRDAKVFQTGFPSLD